MPSNMEKNDLLKQIGFSDEFLKRLEDFENNVIDIKLSDSSVEKIIQSSFDSNNIIIETTLSNSDQELHFKSR